MNDFEFSYPKYLEAKKSIDDRSLNQHVFKTMMKTVKSELTGGVIRILEIGAGTGAMIQRLIEWDFLQQAHYTAIDVEPDNLKVLPDTLEITAKKSGGKIFTQEDGSYLLKFGERRIEVESICSDFMTLLATRNPEQEWDLVIAHAVMDILPLPEALSVLFAALRPGGMFYFTLNYDGLTKFMPVINPVTDELIEHLYNRTMDEREIETGGSHTGQKLFHAIPEAGGKILATGSSDWIVPDSNGPVETDERYFLECILKTVADALFGRVEVESSVVNDWYRQRLLQLEDNRLIYLSHHLDFFGLGPK